MQVIRAGRLIDGTDTSVQVKRDIYVDDGRIVHIAPAGDVPSDADLLDLGDRCVVPGLIDCHVHLVFSCSPRPLADLLQEDDQQLLLRGVAAARQALGAGITTVRDLGGRGGVTFKLRDAIDAGWLAGPRLLAAGSPITITGGHCHFLGVEADDETAVRQAARRELKSGANCLKIMATGGRMTPGTNTTAAQYGVAELRAAVDEAQRAGVTLAAHALGTAGIRTATAAGVNTIEHCNWLLAGAGAGAGADGRVQFDESVAAQMARQGTAVVATLVPLQRSAPVLRGEVLACMRRMASLGVPFAAGTDAGVSLTPFDSLHGELAILVSELGFTPLQAIAAATSVAATALGIAADVGSLQVGRFADVLAVEGDPSTHLEDLRKTSRVLKAGKTVVENGLVL